MAKKKHIDDDPVFLLRGDDEEIFSLRDHGYSQRRIAEETGISVGSVNKILNSREQV